MQIPPLLPAGLAIYAVAVLFATSACRSPAEPGPARPAAIPIPPPTVTEAIHLPGLHNVVTYAPGLTSGGAPEGSAGLETLAAMGFKTIVCVDGAAPDAATASRFGMRYIHLPISYDTVGTSRQLELAKVLANAEGPIYMHCHHGKHRSAAALGCATVIAGRLTPEQAAERMKISGTSPNYKGLWAAVRDARPLAASALRADISDFPSAAKVSGIVATMAEIDRVIDLVKQAQAAGWQAPADHPDLVATKETQRLAVLFANLQNDAESKALPSDYQEMLVKSIALTRDLDRAVRGGNASEAEALMASINQGCKDCHRVHRDQ